MSDTVRALTEDELRQVDALRDTARRRPLTLAQQAEILAGLCKASDLTTPLKLADNIWIALTLEETSDGHCWHGSVSVRGKIPTTELLLSITDRLGFKCASVQFADDARYGSLVRHFFVREAPCS